MAASDKLQITLTDLTGRNLLKQDVTVNAGVTQFEIPVPSEASAGVYVLRISGAQLKKTLRVVQR